MTGTILLDVDTQVDFMAASGALSVPGAEALLPRLEALVAAAQAAGVPHWATTDTHTEADPEFAAYGFPAHCVAGSPGWLRVAETAQAAPVVVALDGSGASAVPGALEVDFRKASFDVGENPGFARALRLAGVEEAYVVGVATEFCVRAACLSLVAAGVRVWVVSDAVAAVDGGAGAAALAELAAKGVRVCRSGEAKAAWARAQAQHSARLGAA